MTGEELAKLPVGTLVLHDGDMGEIIRSGQTVHIMFPGIHTILLDTTSAAWQNVMDELTVEEQ
jgi:hypothetical protein